MLSGELAALLPGPEPELGPNPIPVADTLLDGNEQKYLNQCIESGWISSAGPFVKQFESAFAARVGCAWGISCNSGTTALHLALAALNIGPGDEVIIPTFTMIATISAVEYTGARAVLVDSETETWNLDVAAVKARISPRTRAIIAVHIYGHPVDMDALLELGLPVIEDAAEAHGALYRNRPVGSLGRLATFSFYANKIITTGEGGMVTTNDPHLARMVQVLRDHAFSDDKHFWHKYRGFSYRMSNMQAAVGLAQTERFDDLVARRIEHARWYTERLSGLPGVRLPVEMPHCWNVFWMYAILVAEGTRDDLRRRLAEQGIETRSTFIPIHLQPVHFETYRGERYRVAESLCARGLYLPSGPSLTEADVDRVANAVRYIVSG